MANEMEFWRQFEVDATRWAGDFHAGKIRGVFDEVNCLVLACHFTFMIDITASPAGKCFLIFSPECDPELAWQIDSLVAAAPPLPDWQVFSRRYRKHPDGVAASIRNMYLADISDARYAVVADVVCPEIDMCLPVISEMNAEECQGLVNTLLMNLLGEDVVMDGEITGRCVLAEPPSGIETVTHQELVAMFCTVW